MGDLEGDSSPPFLEKLREKKNPTPPWNSQGMDGGVRKMMYFILENQINISIYYISI